MFVVLNILYSLFVSVYEYFFYYYIVLMTVTFNHSNQIYYLSLNALHFMLIFRDFENLKEEICFEEMINEKTKGSCAR